jgi:hypothetical protein
MLPRLGTFWENVMALKRTLMASVALLFALGGVAAKAEPNTGIPCRVSWSDTTHGGDWLTSVGDATLTQIAPQGDGSFVAIGYGPATVTYHSTGPCGDDVANRTWQTTYMVTVMSQDGHTAEVDVGTFNEEPHSVVTCPSTGHFQYDIDAPELPTTTVQLHEGATPFSEEHAGDHGAAGDAGSVTLHYCTEAHPNG